MKVFKWTIIIFAIILIAIQFIPYGRDHTNPPVKNTVKWDSPETEQFFNRACIDCHSHETEWPWYSNVAPASWLVQYDVEHGRGHFNISVKGDAFEEGEEAAEMVEKDIMPPWYYLVGHLDARLAPIEKKKFIEGLKRTFGNE